MICFLILAALYQSWSLPFSVLLSVRWRCAVRSSGYGRGGSTTTSTRRSALIMPIGLSAKNAIISNEVASHAHHLQLDNLC